MRILSLNAVAMYAPCRPEGLLRSRPTGLRYVRPRTSRLFPLDPRDHFLADVVRRLLVAIEVHRVRRAPLRARTQVRRVAEHLGERHARVDDLRAAAIFLRLNLAAAAREVAHDVPHVLLRDD